MNVLLASLMLTAATTTATAGGILTNTNQSIDFLRNPARDAAIGLDGVYSNPAGVAFMPEGFYLGINWQYAHQTRTIECNNPLFALGKKNNGQSTKTFEGIADAPFLPSIQAAYNKGNWSLQFNFSVPGGGGACEFQDGLGSFESVVGGIANQLKPLGATGYDMDGYMQGRQYYFGFQLGAAYKITKDLSVYGGLRVLYGTATYKAKISNIMVNTANGYLDFGSFLQGATTTIDAGISKVNAGIAQYQAAGVDVPAELTTQLAQLEGTKQSLNSLQKYSQGVNLLCNQSSVGVAPVIGIDWRVGKFNFAAKYEAKTEIHMKNESTVNEASEIPAVNKFRDGEKIDEDSPAQLAVGAMWNISDDFRLNVGYHHFFDKDVKWYNNTQDLLGGGTNEYLAGAEWDLTNKLTISGGGQITRYQLTDEYMNDMSFVVNSYSLGFGFNYKAADNITLKAAYFQTNYGHYDRVTSTEPLISDSFTRTNRVLGIGCELNF
ncbi:Long-chain fatty acid transport protein [Xylanibacter ruminicola]|uniref:Long-chain fatty acid transport protein n=2 Tax=Xylanibacter ruminicola TaxID=839 RepID=A0A1H4F940_XYLRU|nr:Long-chain fatty acid transport protein [Xylanibacter ruminicola]